MTVDSAHDTMRSAPRHNASVARPARERLLQQRKTRVDQLAAIEKGAAQYGSDELTIARLAAVRLALEEIDAALVRLDHGAYGACQHCWTPIAAARLEILPHARFCVRCRSAPVNHGEANVAVNAQPGCGRSTGRGRGRGRRRAGR